MATNFSVQGFTEITTGTTVEVSQSFSFSEAVDEHTTQKTEVADGATDQAIGFGGVTTASVVVLETDKQVTFKINGGTETITVDGLFVLTGSITALSVSNSSGSTANLNVSIGGT